MSLLPLTIVSLFFVSSFSVVVGEQNQSDEEGGPIINKYHCENLETAYLDINERLNTLEKDLEEAYVLIRSIRKVQSDLKEELQEANKKIEEYESKLKGHPHRHHHEVSSEKHISTESGSSSGSNAPFQRILLKSPVFILSSIFHFISICHY